MAKQEANGFGDASAGPVVGAGFLGGRTMLQDLIDKASAAVKLY